MKKQENKAEEELEEPGPLGPWRLTPWLPALEEAEDEDKPEPFPSSHSSQLPGQAFVSSSIPFSFLQGELSLCFTCFWEVCGAEIGDLENSREEDLGLYGLALT